MKERRVVIDTVKRTTADPCVVNLHYTSDLICLLSIAIRMRPDKIIINNPNKFPSYELRQVKMITDTLIESGVIGKGCIVYR